MTNALKVFISGTVSDLAPHRRAAIDTCLSLGIQPISVESIGDSPQSSEQVIWEEIKKADLFIGIIGFRYGYCPPGKNESIIELEYGMAIANEIPRLIFLMSESHPVRISDVDLGETGERLGLFKRRLERETNIFYFTTPEDLSEKVKLSMRKFVATFLQDKSAPSQRGDQSRYFIAHPYYAQSVFINRQKELALLNEWVLSQDIPIVLVHGVGGIGKTALAWKFLEERLSGTRQELVSCFWWSFYEVSNFSAFLNSVDKFISSTSSINSKIKKENKFSRIERIVSAIAKTHHLFVLDGIEELLTTHLADSSQTKSIQAERLRRFVSSDAKIFFQRILNSSLMVSKFLLTSRIVPLDLEEPNGNMLPDCKKIALGTLSSEAAVQLLKSYGVTGSEEFLTDTAAAANNHPLVTRLLAAQFADTSTKRIDLDELTQSKLGEIIDVSLNRLSTNSLLVLQEIASADEPINYDDLVNQLISKRSLSLSPSEIDQVLTELEDRGLINWDRLGGVYNVHRMIRIGVLRNMEQREKNF